MKNLDERKYAALIQRLTDDQLRDLEQRAARAGATPREYVERQEQRLRDQEQVKRAKWIDLQAPIEGNA